MLALQDVFDPSIEAFDHSIGLWGFRRGQTGLDVQLGAEPIERVFAGRGALAQAEEAIGKVLPVIGKDRADTDRASSSKVTQKPPGIGCGFGVADDLPPINRTVRKKSLFS